jgi:hypothetical protein
LSASSSTSPLGAGGERERSYERTNDYYSFLKPHLSAQAAQCLSALTNMPVPLDRVDHVAVEIPVVLQGGMFAAPAAPARPTGPARYRMIDFLAEARLSRTVEVD